MNFMKTIFKFYFQEKKEQAHSKVGWVLVWKRKCTKMVINEWHERVHDRLIIYMNFVFLLLLKNVSGTLIQLVDQG